MQFINQNTGWAVVKQNNYIYTLIRTTNQGTNWSIIYSDSEKVWSIQFFNDTLGYSMGYSNGYHLLSKTTNRGYNWTIMQNSYVYTDFYFVNSDTGWVAAFYLNTPPGEYRIYKTTNALQSLEYIYSASSTIFGGSPSTMKFFKEQYNGEYIGLYLGNGRLWKTTNSGYNWTQINTGFTGNVNSFSFINKDTGWVVQGANTTHSRILKTTNNGINWITQYDYPLTTNYEPDFIFAVSSNILYCGLLNFNYKLLKSTDGGTNWGNQTSQIWNNDIIYLIDSTFGFTWAGNQIARNINGGGNIMSIEKISNSIPISIDLHQNYPNPFNSSTTIEFDIPKSSVVNLKLYDILGREVLSVIDLKEMSGGKYKAIIDLNKIQLSSGIYFYSFFIDGIRIDTKKLMLIK